MINKNLNFTFNHKSQQDKLYKIMTSQQIKDAFDSRGEELKTFIYSVIDTLSTDGASNIAYNNLKTLKAKIDEMDITIAEKSPIGHTHKKVDITDYTDYIPEATSTTLGGIRVGTGLSVLYGKLNANNQSWSQITGKPSIFPPSPHTHSKIQILDMPTKLSEFTDDISLNQVHGHGNMETLNKITSEEWQKIKDIQREVEDAREGSTSLADNLIALDTRIGDNEFKVNSLDDEIYDSRNGEKSLVAYLGYMETGTSKNTTQIADITQRVTTLENSGGGSLPNDLLEVIPSNNLFDYTKVESNPNGLTGKYFRLPMSVGKKYATDLGYRTCYFFNESNVQVGTQTYPKNNLKISYYEGSTYVLVSIDNKTYTSNDDIKIIEGTNIEHYYPYYIIIKNTKNKWCGKKWLVLGDSISTEGETNLAEKSYTGIVAKDLGFKIYVNESISGKEFTDYITNINNFISDYDLVTVMLGTNNHGYNCGLGTFNDGVDYKTNNSFYAKVQKLIELLKVKNPNATILFLTPIRRTGTGSQNNNADGYMINALSKTTEDYANIVKDCCNKYGIHCLDLYEYGINPKNVNDRTAYFMSSDDGTHPNEIGHKKLISPKVKAKLLEIAPIEDTVIPPQTIINVQSVTLNKPTHSMNVNDQITLTPVIIPSYATNQQVTWSASNGNCTVVGGLVTAITQGECVITCTTVDSSKTATCTITIQENSVPTLTTFDYNFTTLTDGDTTITSSSTPSTIDLVDFVGKGVFENGLKFVYLSNAKVIHKGSEIANLNGKSLTFVMKYKKVNGSVYPIMFLSNGIHNDYGFPFNSDSVGKFEFRIKGTLPAPMKYSPSITCVEAGDESNTKVEYALTDYATVDYCKADTLEHTLSLTYDTSDKTFKYFYDGNLLETKTLKHDLIFNGFQFAPSDVIVKRLILKEGVMSDSELNSFVKTI